MILTQRRYQPGYHHALLKHLNCAMALLATPTGRYSIVP